MIKDITKKDKVVNAFPDIHFFSEITIKSKEKRIGIGGFSAEGGIYLNFPYELRKEEIGGILGKKTYYNFVKNSKKMCEHEKRIRKVEAEQKADEVKWKKERIEELKELEKDVNNEK